MPQGVRYDCIFGGVAKGDAAAGRAMSAPAALYEKRAGTVLREAPAHQRPLELRGTVAAHDEPPPRTAPARLAPELQALIDGAPSPGRPVRVVDGRVEVEVLRGNNRARTLPRHEAAGLGLPQVCARQDSRRRRRPTQSPHRCACCPSRTTSTRSPTRTPQPAGVSICRSPRCPSTSRACRSTRAKRTAATASAQGRW